MDLEGRSQHDHPAPGGRQGAFPLHAVPRGTTTAVCGAPVRETLDATWPPGQEARCEACEQVLASGSAKARSNDPDPTVPPDSGNPVHPHGEP